MSRTLAQNGLGKARTLNGLSNDAIDEFKIKYDFDATIDSGTLLIGSSTGNYTANELTAGANITITNGTGQDAKGTITIASSQLVINAGTNLSKTTSINGDITINLDAVIGGMTSINGFTLVSNISSAANQFLLKDNSVGGFPSASFLTTNANGLIVPTTQAVVNTVIHNTILGGTNISKASAGGNITLNLDATLTSITSINDYTLSTNVSSAGNQFLIKDNSVGAFPNNGFLTTNSNGLVSGTSQDVIKTFIHSSILGGTNITKNTASGNITLNLNAVLSGLTSIDGTSDLPLKRAGVEKIKLEATKVEFKENSSTAGANLLLKKGSGNQTNNADYQLKQEYIANGFRTNEYDAGVRFQRFLSSSDFTQLFCGYQQSEGQSIWLNPNNDLHYIFRSGVLKIAKPDESSHNFSIQLGNNSSTFTMTNLTSANFDCDTFKCCKSRFHGIRSGNNLFLFNSSAQQAVVGNNLNFLEQNGDGSLLKLRGTTIKLLSTTNEIISLDNTAISCSRKLAINSNAINFTSSTDNNHQIVYSNNSGGAMDGLLIRGFGNNDTPFVKLQCANGDIDVITVHRDKIKMLKPLDMGNNNINLKLDSTEHYIRYSNDNMDGVEVVGKGVGVKPIFRVASSNASPITTVIEALQDQIKFYKTLIFPSVSASGSDFSAIKYTSDKKLRISFPESGELRFDKEDNSVNYFKTIKQGGGANGRTFFFEQGGDNNASNGGAFQSQCSQGKMVFQGDRNLVIYRPAGETPTVAFASGNSASSRDYKKNIIDLVEDESVNVIKQINPVSFEYIEEYWDECDNCDACDCNVRKGFIWEDMKPILPQSAKSINCHNPDMPMTKLLD